MIVCRFRNGKEGREYFRSFFDNIRKKPIQNVGKRNFPPLSAPESHVLKIV